MDEQPCVNITREMLDAAKTPAGGYTKEQIQVFFGSPTKGWRKKLIGKRVPAAQWERFANPPGSPIIHGDIKTPATLDDVYELLQVMSDHQLVVGRALLDIRDVLRNRPSDG